MPFGVEVVPIKSCPSESIRIRSVALPLALVLKVIAPIALAPKIILLSPAPDPALLTNSVE